MKSKTLNKNKRAFIWVSWTGYAFVVAVLVVLIFFYLLMTPPSELMNLQGKVKVLSRFGALLQIAGAICVLIFWRKIVMFLYRREIVLEHELQKVIYARKTLALVLVIYLLLFPIGPVSIFNFITKIY